jgi:tetratricopeptide (TPR) repeat protein
MRRWLIPAATISAIFAGCASAPPERTLAGLRGVEPDTQDIPVEQGLERAMDSYRRFLEETPESELTPEAMRRLADLQVEKEFGLRAGDGKPREMAAPERAERMPVAQGSAVATAASIPGEWTESDLEFENRTTVEQSVSFAEDDTAVRAASGAPEPSGPLEAIALYERLLTEYPGYEHNDQVLYQMSRAYDELGRTEDAMAAMDRIVAEYAYAVRYDEVQFRRGEFFFTRRKYREGEAAYSAVVSLGPSSSYHELALYKLGWTFYKQEFYEEALHQYTALLDYKLSVGYDFDQHQSEDDERRITDTFRVISLSFSNLGGPDVVQEYFGEFGNRDYEYRIYDNLGEYFLEKLRYDDAARSYRAFEDLYPFHRESPRFGMRVVEVFTKGEFPQLVLESKKEFAGRYGLQGEYWRHFDPAGLPEVLGFLKTNLHDLANHYHALYQDAELVDEKPANYGEALHWYREYLASFPTDVESPSVNYQVADLLLENEDFGQAALEYERTAYDYSPHSRAAEAGYAAIYAHREHLKVAQENQQDAVRRQAVASSLRFADTFPQHEYAASVLGAAADDLYGMKDLVAARSAAQRVVDAYPGAEQPIRRSAWIVVAHASFDLGEYLAAETAYGEVLAATPGGDETRAAFVDNYAASIYKQGEAASEAGDYRTAAGHFLRIRDLAPTSTIRAAAEYDAGAALIRLQDWTGAAGVFDEFRRTHPDHELAREATKQIAFSYREDGQPGNAAREYGRVASESDDPALRAEALLVAGGLYEDSGQPEAALRSYVRYVEEFEKPVETAVETRARIADLYRAGKDEAGYYRELENIVRVDRNAGAERTGRTRTIAGRAALVLAERLYGEFVAVRLAQPFDVSLQRKQTLMDTLIAGLGGLVDYELADVTAAATFYIAETYLQFSRALMESERPTDLAPADLADYELALEEEAFPFEEQAIEVHEKNLELLHGGVFNDWTGKSLAHLAELVPGRYARTELSAGFLPSLETYAYRSPAAEAPAVAAPEPSVSGTAQARRPAEDVEVKSP